MKNKFVTYEQFGAAGDGVTDDFAAIIACHQYANENSIPVRANDDATYYIGPIASSAKVRTSVDFGKAKFIIDDRCVEDRTKFVFYLDSDNTYASNAIDISELHRQDKRIDFPHEGKVLVRVTNDNEKIYIREGLNQNNGTPTSEFFIVDENGNILTDLNWNYPTVTSAVAKRIDDEPITIKGGIFTTIANQEESRYNYYNRGIAVRRSNVTIEGLTHYVEGELDHGAPYSSFISSHEVCNLTIKDCLLTPHMTYYSPTHIPGKTVPMGSYDINLGSTIGARLISLKQTVDIMDRRYWGIICSNFCKDIELDGCVVSRFDAHMGVTNATIKNSTLGHQCLNLIGHGKFVLENSEAFGQFLIHLRGDYGAHFDGDITIRNCVWRPAYKTMTAIGGYNEGTHFFGYECKMPRSITIEGLRVLDGAFENENTELYILPEYAKSTDAKPYPYTPTEMLTISGVSTESGRVYKACPNFELYKRLKIIIK